MTKEQFFELVRASQFFPVHCPGVKRYYHKMRGVDGNGQPLDFTPEDKKAMREAAKKLGKEFAKVKF